MIAGRLKYLFFISLLLMIFACGCSGKKASDIDIIRKMMVDYKGLMLVRDFEAMTDYVHPVLIKRFSRDTLIKTLKFAFDNENYRILPTKLTYDSLMGVFPHASNKYAMTSYSLHSTFMFKETEDPEMRNEFYKNLCEGFRIEFGVNNVKCDEIQKLVYVTIPGKIFFVYENRYKKWFILPDNNPADVEQLIPATIRAKFRI